MLCNGQSSMFHCDGVDGWRSFQTRRRLNETLKFPFTILEAVCIMLQILEGMKYLHDNRVVHRGLKSQNILVKCLKATEMAGDQYVHVKVADFGLSKSKESSSSFLSLTPNLGTSRWMAPELMKPGAANSQASTSDGEDVLRYPFKCDVYSFGMVCYEILTGEIPFFIVSSQDEVKKKVLGGDRPELPDQCPYILDTLITKCWNSEARARPSFVDICAELRSLKCLLLTGLRGQKPSILQQDALVACKTLWPRLDILADELPIQIILEFLTPHWPIDVINATVAYSDSTADDVADPAVKLLESRGAVEATLIMLEKCPMCSGSLKCASRLPRVAVENTRVRLRVAEIGLQILVRYVQHYGTVYLEELLATKLVLCCGEEDNSKEGVVRADGHKFLLTCLCKNVRKKIAAQGLLHLVENTSTQSHVLDAGLVTTSLSSIDRNFASSEIPLALARISASEAGLDQIHACSELSVPALSILLEYCPTSQGKEAAAAVLARLYPRLSNDKTSHQNNENS